MEQVEATETAEAPVEQEPEQPEQAAPEAPEQESAEQSVEQSAEQPQIFKIKAAGKEREVTLDELKKSYQMAEGASNRMREAAEAIKYAKSLVSNPGAYFEHMAKSGTNPQDILSHFLQFGGQSAQQALQDYVTQQVQLASMPQEEQEALRQQQELDYYREQEQARLQQIQEQQEQAKYQQAVSQLQETYQMRIGEAAKEAGMELTPEVMENFVVKIQALRRNGHDGEIDYNSLAELIKSEEQERSAKTIENLDLAEAMKNKAFAKRVNDYLRSKKTETVVSGSGQSVSQSMPKTLTPDEWRHKLGL